MGESTNVSGPGPSLAWLADAPLFIDSALVDAFYDAVVRPEGLEGKTTLQITKAAAEKLGGKVGAEATFSLAQLFPFLGAKVAAEVAGEESKSEEEATTVELYPISTPQRQLLQLVLHYAANLGDRLSLVNDVRSEDWRSPAAISRVPRAIACIDLPSQAEAASKGLPETMAIPVAAEFSNGEIVLIYETLFPDGPVYPEPRPGKSPEEQATERMKYWKWFEEHFSATKAMLAVEEAARGKDRGRVRWIGYRVPLTTTGDTLRLNVCPAGRYDTGVLAYNLIKRGYKHGLRLVGTLKSEPDMNVMAIFEK